jgi:tryptophanyl-tRNA synthetase
MSNNEIMLSAIQPSNVPHLGNYLGAIKNWVKLQELYKCYFFVVDMHSITSRHDPKELRDLTWLAVATYIASGINADEATLFCQSHVPQHAELAWTLNCYSYMGELNRMTQYKDKSQKSGKNISVGIFDYPVLMAADILLYDAKMIPVGADQKQHIELTRDVATRMNGIYGDDTFVVPEPFIAPVGARIMDFQSPTSKMSKSAESESGVVFLTDTPKQIEKKIKKATTDSGSEIIFDDSKPGIKNLLSIQSAINGTSIDDLVKSYEGKMYGHLKVDTAEIVVNELRPIQERTAELLDDKTELAKILAKGAEKAAEHAEKTLSRVYDRVGFLPGRLRPQK